MYFQIFTDFKMVPLNEPMPDKSEIGEKLELEAVPVVDVTKENFLLFEPTIRLGIQKCDFIAIDCELSGLGDRKKLNSSSIDERFLNSSIVAQTRSIISLGLSIFKQTENEQKSDCLKSYAVQTYNIVVLCSEDYIVEPGSVNFLVQHGFNFNQQYTEGVPYYRGNDRKEATAEENRLRTLFTQIILNKKKVVFHNGFVDMVFLYQNLYAQLPRTLPTFIADLCEMFPNGIYDTKYIADYICRTEATFLEFVFKKLHKVNKSRYSKQLTHINIEFVQYPTTMTFVNYIKCRPQMFSSESNKAVCKAYANHGNCQITDCNDSHDVDYILACQEDNQSSKKRRKKNGPNITSKANGSVNVESNTSKLEEKLDSKKETNISTVAGHRAGMDAFMTGYSYAAFIWHKSKVLDGGIELPSDMKDSNITNHIYLVGKEFPLTVKRSNFAKNSTSHAEKYENVLNELKNMSPVD